MSRRALNRRTNMETIRLGIIMNGDGRHCAAAGACAPRPVTPISPR
jgi:hypothetical protein